RCWPSTASTSLRPTRPRCRPDRGSHPSPASVRKAIMASTEAVSPRYAGIDQWATEDLVDGMIEGQFAALAAVTTAAGPIVGAIDAATERLRDGGRLVYVGAGTSGRIAAQDAAELPPTFA